jgi:hypothetical protein
VGVKHTFELNQMSHVNVCVSTFSSKLDLLFAFVVVMPFSMDKTVKANKRSNNDDGDQPRKIPKAGDIITGDVITKTQLRPNSAPVVVCIYKYRA